MINSQLLITSASTRPSQGKRVVWVNCHIREHFEVALCFMCQGYSHVSHGCTLSGRKDACWGVEAHCSWLRNKRIPLGAWLVLIGAKRMSPMLRGAVRAQYLWRRSEGWGVECEISTAQPRKREEGPEPSDADCQGEEGRCVAVTSQ